MGRHSDGRGRGVISVILRIISSVRGSVRTWEPNLAVAGVVLIVSGLLHTLVWLFSDSPWEGSVSWRKPILFGVSTGLTLLSVAWLLSRLRPVRGDVWWCRTLAFSLTLEVTLITIQQWRSLPSHFNQSSWVNLLIDQTMTVLIVIAAAILMRITIRSFSALKGTQDQRLAIRAGLVFLMISCLIGFGVLIHGYIQTERGLDPGTYGQNGVMKFPHGIAIHALQILPILSWSLKAIGIDESRRRQLIWLAIVSLSGQLLFSLLQTLRGLSRFDFDIVSGVVLASSIFPLLVIFATMTMQAFAFIHRGSRLDAKVTKAKSTA